MPSGIDALCISFPMLLYPERAYSTNHEKNASNDARRKPNERSRGGSDRTSRGIHREEEGSIAREKRDESDSTGSNFKK